MAEGWRMWVVSLLTIMLVGDMNISGSVAGDVVSIGHQVNIDVHGHTHDHHHHEDDTVTIEEQHEFPPPRPQPKGMPSVVRFLKNLKLDEYISAFEEQHIDMEVLEDCEPEELEQMLEKLEVSLGHSKKIKKALKHEKQEKKEKMNLEEKKEQMKKEQEREEDQLENIGSNIRVASGQRLSYLSCTPSGKVDLWYRDDNSGRQKWILNHLFDDVYNILVSGGTNPGEKFLSCRSDGFVDLWTHDDGSGRQKWRIQKIGRNTYNIKIFGGTNQGEEFLSCTEGGLVDLWSRDDYSGRQRWELTLP